MRTLALAMIAWLVLGGAAVSGEQNRNSRARGKQDKRDHDRVLVHGEVGVVFSTDDLRIIREHYAPQHRQLPPGLRKKLARTGALPPGWQKKLRPFPVKLERRLGGLPDEFRRGVIDGQVVIYNRHTQVIFDVAVPF